MAVIRVEGVPRPIVSGMAWVLLRQSTSERSEIKQIVTANRMKFGCVIGDRSAGLRMVGLTEERSGGSASGAAWLAAASEGQPIILAEPLGDDRVWLCGVRAGLPLTGLDIVVPLGELDAKLEEFLDEAPGSEIHSTIAGLDERFSSVSPIAFAEHARKAAPQRIKRLYGVDPRLIGAGLVCVALIYGVPWVQDYLAQAEQQEAKAKLRVMNADQAAKAREQQEAERKASLALLEAQIVSSVSSRPGPPDMVAAYVEAIGQIPLFIRGWRADTVDCTGGSCTVSWKRQPIGTVLSMTEGAEELSGTLISVAGSDASTVHVVDARPRSSDLALIGEWAPFGAAVETALQQFRTPMKEYAISPPAPLAPPPVASGPTGAEQAGASAATVPNSERAFGEHAPVWKVGSISVSGKYISTLRDLALAMDHPGISVKNMRMDLSTGSWSLEMNYATR